MVLLTINHGQLCEIMNLNYPALLAPEQVKSINPSWINIEVVTQKEFSLFNTHESF